MSCLWWDRDYEKARKMRKAFRQVMIFVLLFLALDFVFLGILHEFIKIKIDISFAFALGLAFLIAIVIRSKFWK